MKSETGQQQHYRLVKKIGEGGMDGSGPQESVMLRYMQLLTLVLGALLSAAPSFGQTTEDPSPDASTKVLWRFETGG
jgi:hypothetical protein